MTQTSATSPDLLETIVAAARRIVAVRKATVSEESLERRRGIDARAPGNSSGGCVTAPCLA